MIVEALKRVVEREDLAEDEAAQVMAEIMEGRTTEAQIAGLLTALRMKGETPAEVSGFARSMREKAAHVPTIAHTVVDTCGTGGDVAQTFNISTTTAFVVAGAGVVIAKHGNRSVSSQCGSADVLEALGVRIDLAPGEVARCIDEIGIGFLFAPIMHPAMKHAVGPRREMGIRTVFNILGPLTNPAGAKHQLVGVFSEDLVDLVANVLARLGTRHAMVVFGEPGLDELSTVGESLVAEAGPDGVRTYRVTPEDFGFERARAEDLSGGGPDENAEVTKAVLDGEAGPRRDVVLLNAAAALVAADVVADVGSGVSLASESIDTGAARARLNALVTLSQGLAAEREAVDQSAEEGGAPA